MMRLEFFPIPLLVGTGILLVISAMVWYKKRDVSHLITFFLFGLYLVFLIGLTLFPVPVSSPTERQSAASILSRINFIPFRYGWVFFAHPFRISFEIVGNILLTIPYGLGVIFVAPKIARRIMGWLLGIGFAIETSQLLASLGLGLAYRGVDINDVIFNDLGAMLGFGIFKLFAWIFIKVKRRFGLTPKGFFAFVDKVILQTVSPDPISSTSGKRARLE